MKKLLLLSLTLLSVMSLWADDRTEEEMQQIAISQLMGAQVKGLFPTQFHVDRLQDYDEFNVYGNDDGFVFVSRDNRFTPVLGYAEGRFDAANMPEGLKWWIEAMNASLQWRRDQGFDEEARQLQRAQLMAGYTPVSNFVAARWGQGDPYNSKCPKVGSSLPPCGCVATAMGQIMKYYAYPAQGKGNGGYSIGSGSEKRVSVEGTYNWSAMKNSYVTVKADDRNAVGPLTRDCGYAAHMTYDADGSGAFTHNAAAGFCYNFGYDSLAIRYYNRDLFADEDWMSIIYDELTAKRPILYGGVDKTYGGHAFVFSGFNSSGLIYVNWGWNGDANGFYDMSDLAPSGILGSSVTDHFNYDQDMIFGFRPTETSAPGESYESMWGTDSWKLSLSGSSLRFSCDSYYNYHFQTFYGKIGICFENINGSETYFLPIYDHVESDPLYGFGGSSKTIKSSDLTSMPAGTYRVFFASQHLKDPKPQFVRAKDKGAIYYELTKAAGGSLSLSAAKQQLLSPTYNLIYMVDGEVYATYQLAFGAPITPEPDPVKPGYTFSGWSSIPATMPNTEVVVTGSFVMNPTHTLNYILDGYPYKSVTLPEGIVIEPEEVPAREGYKFMGWEDLPEIMPKHDLTVHGFYRACQVVKLSGAGYATFYDEDNSYDLPSGVKTFVVSDVTDGKLTYVNLDWGAIPYKTAVILKGNAGEEIELLGYSGVVTLVPYSGINLLHGSNSATKTHTTGYHFYYKLAYGHSDTYQSEVFGWYWGAADGEAFDIEAHRAWLAVPYAVVLGKPRYFLIDGTPESVLAGGAEAPATNEPMYDLQGRRVVSPVKGGIYVRNGRKVFVK